MRRVLFVHYHFLPVHNVAVGHLLGYARRLPAYGWEALVLTRRWRGVDEAEPSWGLSWEPQLEPLYGCRIYRAESPPVVRRGVERARDTRRGTARKLVAKAERLGQMAFGAYPDEFTNWIEPAVEVGERLARETPIDLILSYCPPETNHVVGRRLARRLRVPWLPFFGDMYGFLDPPLPARSLEGWAKRAWHRWCLAPAAASAAVSPAMVGYLARAYRKPSHLILVGYDAEEFGASPATEPRGRMRISHVGSLYPGDQRPEIFFDGLDRFLAECPEALGPLEVCFVGSKCDEALRAMLAGRPAERVCRVRPKVGPAAALEIVRESDALLAFTCTAHRDRFGTLSYPTKIFEAFGAKRPVLVMPPDRDWVDALLERTRGGRGASDARQVGAVLRDWFTAWQRDGRLRYDACPDALAELTCQRQTERLATVFSSISRG